MSTLEKPLPDPDAFGRVYWDYARTHELRLPACENCGQARAHFVRFCPGCGADAFDWKKMSGRGEVWSYCLFHKAFGRALESQLPYNVAVVRLDEGPMLVSSIVGANYNELYIGMIVEAKFEDVSPDVTLIKFMPEQRGDQP